MRWIAPLLLLAGCQPVGGAGGGAGGGIVSTNPCADAILVRLVPPARIAAISRWSRDAGATSVPLAVANRFRATGGTAEEVLALRPSLVLASSFTLPATRDAYARAGLRVLYLDSPTTVAASIAQVRQVAAAVGEPGRGEAMARAVINAVRPELVEGRAVINAVRPELVEGHTIINTVRPELVEGHSGSGASTGSARTVIAPAALLYIAGDLANGSGTLLDELTRRAGFRNAAADYGLAHTGTLPAELLVAHPPAVVIGGGGHGAALRRRLLPGTPEAAFPRQLVNCGGPTIPAAMARLSAIRAMLP